MRETGSRILLEEGYKEMDLRKFHDDRTLINNDDDLKKLAKALKISKRVQKLRLICK